MEDTISILRGLKERYEIHHGVKIKDSAIVAAAMLSNRYITDRFLPDKAIDLIDEAAASLRMQIDSLPVEIDAVERQIIQLEIERQALSKEDDPASRERLRVDREGTERAARKVHADEAAVAAREGTDSIRPFDQGADRSRLTSRSSRPSVKATTRRSPRSDTARFRNWSGS